jgi:hypothetical protein
VIYVTDSPISLLTYYVLDTWKRKPKIIREANEVDVRAACISMGGIGDSLDAMEQSIHILEYKSKKIPFLEEHGVFNTTYIWLSELNDSWDDYIKEWKHIEYLKLSPNLYKKNVDALSSIFTRDGLEYFWYKLCLKRFDQNPLKWNIELSSLLVKFSISKERFTEDMLKSIYDKSEGNSSYLSNIGTDLGTQVLRDMDKSELWTMFIGSDSRPPALYGYLMGRCPDLWTYVSILREAVIDGATDLRVGAIIMNEGFIRLGLIRKFKTIDIDCRDSFSLESYRNLIYE